jgi:hypothetical protein
VGAWVVGVAGGAAGVGGGPLGQGRRRKPVGSRRRILLRKTVRKRKRMITVRRRTTHPR